MAFTLTQFGLQAQKNNMFCDIHKERIIWIDKDSIVLHPFEMYGIMRFGTIDYGLTETLQFTLNENEHFSFENAFKDRTIYDQEGNRKSIFNIELALPSYAISDSIKRQLFKGVLYKVIFSYESVAMGRIHSDWGGEDDSHYFIVDLVPIGSKFERQIPFQYNSYKRQIPNMWGSVQCPGSESNRYTLAGGRF